MRGLPDSGLIVRLTRGRSWIAVLSVLLTGIVALNVVILSLNASQGKIAQESLILEQENSALRARLAQRFSNDHIRNAAGRFGMSLPSPNAISYVDTSPKSTQLTAQRLAAWSGSGTILASTPSTGLTSSAGASTAATTSTSTTTTGTYAPPTATAAVPSTSSTSVSTPSAPTTSAGTPGGVAPG